MIRMRPDRQSSSGPYNSNLFELNGSKIVEPCCVVKRNILYIEPIKERKIMAGKNIEQEQPLRDEISLPKVLHALSDPVRLEIVLKLAGASEIACGCFGLTMPKSSLSHHFKVLRSSGVVATRREGKE